MEMNTDHPRDPEAAAAAARFRATLYLDVDG
jgi:hypothetical protein